MGRDVLYAHEMRDMLLAERIRLAYNGRKASADWGQWAEKFPYENGLLAEIETRLHDHD